MTDRDNDWQPTPAPFDTLRTAPTDADVRAALADNDHAAWAIVVPGLTSQLRRFLVRAEPAITPDDLDTTIQETWRKAWEKRALFARDDQYAVHCLVNWCAVIAHNTYLDTVKRRQYRAHPWSATLLADDLRYAYEAAPDPDPWPEAAAIGHEQLDQCRRLLAYVQASSRPRLRACLPYLTGGQHNSRSDLPGEYGDPLGAARDLGITHSAAKSRLCRLRRAMRLAITRHVGLPPTATLAEVLAAERQDASA